MAEEEFTDDDFDDLPPVPPGPIKRVIHPANPPAVKKPVAQQPVQPATRDAATPTEKYGVYSIPTRIGVFDNELQRPVIEESDAMSVLLSLLVKIANDVDEIKGRL